MHVGIGIPVVGKHPPTEGTACFCKHRVTGTQPPHSAPPPTLDCMLARPLYRTESWVGFADPHSKVTVQGIGDPSLSPTSGPADLR